MPAATDLAVHPIYGVPAADIDAIATSLADALARATPVARLAGETAVVVVTVHDGRAWFAVLTAGTYVLARERGLTKRLAPVAAVYPNGQRNLYGVVAL